MSADETREITPAGLRWMAAVFLFFGMLVLAMAFGWIKTKPSAVHAPLWVLVSAGMMFNLGSVMIFLMGRARVDSLRNAVSWLFVLALSLPFNWVAFGEGERHFSSSVRGFGVAATSSSGEWTGRLMFGFFALLMDAILAWALIRVLCGKTAFDPPKP